jgi:site-specific recombinase XerD
MRFDVLTIDAPLSLCFAVFASERKIPARRSARKVWSAVLSRFDAAIGREATGADLTVENLEAFALAAGRSGLSPWSVHSYLQKLRRLWRFLYVFGVPVEKPPFGVKSLARPRPDSYAVSRWREERAARRAAARRAAEPKPPRPLTLATPIAECLTAFIYHRKPGLSRTRLKDWRGALRALSGTMARPATAADLTNENIRRAGLWMFDRALTPPRLYRQIGLLRSLLRFLAEQGLTDEAPTRWRGNPRKRRHAAETPVSVSTELVESRGKPARAPRSLRGLWKRLPGMTAIASGPGTVTRPAPSRAAVALPEIVAPKMSSPTAAEISAAAAALQERRHSAETAARAAAVARYGDRLEDWFSLYLALHPMSDETRKGWRLSLTALAQHLGRPGTLADLTADTLAAFENASRRVGKPAGSVRVVLAKLRALWGFCADVGAVPREAGRKGRTFGVA